MHRKSQSAFSFGVRLFVLAIVLLLLTRSGTAQIRLTQRGWTAAPTTWWPDPETGLMWTGTALGVRPSFSTHFNTGLGYDRAAQYCSNLKLGGYTGWRLPTLGEVKASTQVMRVLAVTVLERGVPTVLPNGRFFPLPPELPPSDALGEGNNPDSYLAYFPKGRELLWGPGPVGLFDAWIWTSTPSSTDSGQGSEDSAETFYYDASGKEGDPLDRPFKKAQAGPWAVCVRAMEPELAKIAAQAGPVPSVPDVETLKKYIPFNNARLAYEAGNYQETINDAKQALQGLPKMSRAYWAMGIAYGRLGQWNQAISYLKKARGSIFGREDGIIEASLNWAEDSKKATNGKQVDEKTPQWFPYPTVLIDPKTWIPNEQKK